MNVAAFETSSRPASVALRVEDRTYETVLEGPRAHASDLLPALERMTREAGCDDRHVDAILVGVGPGSYTGLRVGIATAVGLARGFDARLLGIPSGETLAYRALEPGQEGSLLIDARQQELYFAHYRRTANDVEVIEPPTVVAAATAAEKLRANATILGDEAAAQAAGLTDAQRERLLSDAFPSASALLELGAMRLETNEARAIEAVQPLYLRPFAAKPRRR